MAPHGVGAGCRALAGMGGHIKWAPNESMQRTALRAAADGERWVADRAFRFDEARCAETISLRHPTALLSDLKVLANKRDVPYQSLLKVYLADRVTRETIGRTRPDIKALQPASRSRRRAARG